MKKTNIKIGDWIWVKSPLKGDVNKRKGFGQEIRPAYIESIKENGRLVVQMFTTKQLETNWNYKRNNGDIISARKHYCVEIKESMIIKKYKNKIPLTIEEISKIKELKTIFYKNANRIKKNLKEERVYKMSEENINKDKNQINQKVIKKPVISR